MLRMTTVFTAIISVLYYKYKCRKLQLTQYNYLLLYNVYYESAMPLLIMMNSEYNTKIYLITLFVILQFLFLVKREMFIRKYIFKIR